MTFRKLRVAVLLLGSFAWDLIASTLVVARIVISPRARTHPALVVMPITLTRPWAIAMLAYFTSLTPGSTCLHVAADHKRIYLHLLDARDPDATIARFRRIYERRILDLER